MGEGLRERKRRRTRAAISDAAMGLFLARGFEQVSVVEIAAAAEVSEKTVYNYFPVKAELVFDAGDELLAELLDALDQRPTGAPALDGVRAFVARRAERAAAASPPPPGPWFRELIAASPTLQAYRREMFARWEHSLAAALARDTDTAASAAEPFVVAVAVIGVLRAALETPPGPAGPGPEHNSAVALAVLAAGLADYAPAPRRRSAPTPTAGATQHTPDAR